MELNGTSENEFVNLLLSAAHEGNVSALETHLLSVVNPNLYLDRAYDEAHMQKCTLLTIACLNGHVDIIRMLLCRFKPDLEVLNNVIFGDGNPNRQIFLNVSVLWTAASINNFEMVTLLVENGANVNHTTKTNSTALRGACFNGNVDMARYLIKNGGDINITKENNDTNLMVSVCQKHLDVVTYLVDELHCDVNACDNDGRPPLYDAVNCGSLEIVEFLLNHGARNFRAVRDQMSPVMWAAEKKRPDLLEAISSHCSLLEKIEAEELLGSALICGSHGDRALDQSFEHFCRALELRLAHNLPKALRLSTNEIFGNRQECQTVGELEKIRSNFNSMSIEALLVRERLLGSSNGEYRYSLCYRGAILADNGQHNEAVAYWIYELGLCQQYSIPLDPKHLRRFASLFSGMLCKTKSVPMEALIKIITAAMKELEHNKEKFNHNLYTLLFLITIASQVKFCLCYVYVFIPFQTCFI
jgi:ankyrin repeat protein